jgi:hypothetical protein
MGLLDRLRGRMGDPQTQIDIGKTRLEARQTGNRFMNILTGKGRNPSNLCPMCMEPVPAGAQVCKHGHIQP